MEEQNKEGQKEEMSGRVSLLKHAAGLYPVQQLQLPGVCLFGRLRLGLAPLPLLAPGLPLAPASSPTAPPPRGGGGALGPVARQGGRRLRENKKEREYVELK